MNKNDLTPRERGMLRALQHSAEPLSLRQLGEKTGYKSIQPFRIEHSIFGGRKTNKVIGGRPR
jgi:hypothetical protein